MTIIFMLGYDHTSQALSGEGSPAEASGDVPYIARQRTCPAPGGCVPDRSLAEWQAEGLRFTVDASCLNRAACVWVTRDADHRLRVVEALNRIEERHGAALMDALFDAPGGTPSLTVALAGGDMSIHARANVRTNTMLLYTMIPSVFDVVHEAGHLLDFRAGGDRQFYSDGAIPNASGDTAAAGAGGAWTQNVPGWLPPDAQNGMWHLADEAGTVSRYAATNPWEDFAETFEASVMAGERHYAAPSPERAGTLRAAIQVVTS